MKNGSFLKSQEEVNAFTHGGQMNRQEGIYLAWLSNPEVISKILPPPLQMVAPIVSAYIINIQEPNFTSHYLEACIAIPAAYNGEPGLYLVNLQLSGPGAFIGSSVGREEFALPKKIADEICLVRTGDNIKAYVVRNGIRIIEVQAEVGEYNTPDAKNIFGEAGPGVVASGAGYMYKYDIDCTEEGKAVFSNARLIKTNLKNIYDTFEPATAEVTLNPSENDPWAELEIVQILGAAYSRNSCHMLNVQRLTDVNTEQVIPYLMTGRYDASLWGKICNEMR